MAEIVTAVEVVNREHGDHQVPGSIRQRILHPGKAHLDPSLARLEHHLGLGVLDDPRPVWWMQVRVHEDRDDAGSERAVGQRQQPGIVRDRDGDTVPGLRSVRPEPARRLSGLRFDLAGIDLMDP